MLLFYLYLYPFLKQIMFPPSKHNRRKVAVNQIETMKTDAQGLGPKENHCKTGANKKHDHQRSQLPLPADACS